VEQCRIVLGRLHPYQIVTQGALNRASNRSLGPKDMEAEMPRDFFHRRSQDNFVWDVKVLICPTH
jgi:hypothetical protein